MLFTSYQYIIFLAVVIPTYFALAPIPRRYFLLAASCVFYMAFVPEYILILFAVILVDYCAGISLERVKAKHRRWVLFASLASNLGLLAFFKYFNFFSENIESLVTALGGHWTIPRNHILLPIGLSFHTFQSLSYTFEVYYRRQKAEQNLAVLATYVLFFPQMVAGPIERPQNLLPQFHRTRNFRYQEFVLGMRRILLGLVKKLLIADPLGNYCDYIFSNPAQAKGGELLLATFAFTFQIYFDFSGYSDIALGSARILGFRLMENFANPYLSLSIREFWQRWHISLSTWFRDYVYIPLGGNRVPLARSAANLFVVFGLSGLWHGANWTFVVWGLCHAGALALQTVWTKLFPVGKKRAHPITQLLRWGATFSFVSLTWIFFRANSLSDAVIVFKTLAHSSFGASVGFDGYFPKRVVISLLMGAGVILFVDGEKSDRLPKVSLNLVPSYGRILIYAVVILTIFNLGSISEVPFIYFQF